MKCNTKNSLSRKNKMSREYRSTLRLPEELQPFSNPPPPSSFAQRLSHALPLPLHIFTTAVSVSMNICTAIAAHFIDGPVKDEWSLGVSVLHAGVKSIMIAHPPQSRHGLPLIRALTSFQFPLLITPMSIRDEKLKIVNARAFDEMVLEALDLDLKLNLENTRTLLAEYQDTAECTNKQLIVYIHGG